MAEARFFIRPINTGAVELTGQEAHHLSAVRRLGPGDRISLFDGEGGMASATIERVSSASVQLHIESVTKSKKRSVGHIVLAASMAKGERFDWLVSRCTELGVDRICPVFFERTVKRPRSANLVRRYERLAIEAAKQCGRLYLPRIDPADELPEVIDSLKLEYPQAVWLMGSLETEATSLVALDWSGRDVVVFVGPEGGFSSDELSRLMDRQVRQVKLTETTLRVETAAVAFCSILSTQRHAVKGVNGPVGNGNL